MSQKLRSTAAYTSEFHHEFRVETGRLLRRRFLWFTGLLGGLGAITMLWAASRAFSLSRSPIAEGARGSEGELVFDWRSWTVSFLWLGLYVGSFLYAFRRRPADEVLLRLSFWVVALDGVLNVVTRTAELYSIGIAGFMITHIVACLFLPWTAWQALRPMFLVLAVHAASVLLIGQPVWEHGLPGATILALAATTLIALPGTLWCMFRHSRRTQDFRYRFMTSRYSEMRRELVDARKIHESLFPRSISDGELRFSFDYEPMRQIGGDFLFAKEVTGEDGCNVLSVVLLDVTGHGIPAALTVNRLHGELERVFAENPHIGPGEVLKLLNRYVHLTLATHSIYATAFCARIDTSRSKLEYASGGHPPAFLRAVDGTIEELESTAIVLGACAHEDFEPGERTLTFGPGDAMIAYTDGAIEATDLDGRMFRLDGLRKLIATADRRAAARWPETFREHVAGFRGGPPADDTLFLTVHRIAGGASSQRKPSAAAGSHAAAEVSA